MRIRSAHLFLLLVIVMIAAGRNINAQQPSGGEISRRTALTKCQTPVTVAGAVFAPSRFELRRRVRLNELLARSGGFTERAGTTVEIARAGLGVDCGNHPPGGANEKPGTVEVYEIEALKRSQESANPYVQPGDFIRVTEVGVAYIVGNVKTPQRILLKESTTITEAIKMAGGLRSDSRLDRVRIIRHDPWAGSAAKELIADLQAIQKGRATDVLIKPYDIVEVQSKRERGRSRPISISVPAMTAEPPLRIIY